MQAPWSRLIVFSSRALRARRRYARLLIASLALGVPLLLATFSVRAAQFFDIEPDAGEACVVDRSKLQPPPPSCHTLVCSHFASTVGLPGVAGWRLDDHCAGFSSPVEAYFYPKKPCPPFEHFIDPGSCKSGPVEVGKNLGQPNCGVGNPCDPGTGNKYLAQTDYRSADGLLSFTRYYNSQLQTHQYHRIPFPDNVGLGIGWTSNVHKHLHFDGPNIIIRRADGRGEKAGDPDSKLSLTQDATGYTLTLGDGATERYNDSGHIVSESDRAGKTTTYAYDIEGRLQTVTGPFGRTLTFTHSSNRLRTMTDPAGKGYGYSVTGNRLNSVSYPGGGTRFYRRDDSNFPHVTRIIDEINNTFATYTYDDNGRATSTEHAGGQERFTLSYVLRSVVIPHSIVTAATVTDAIGTQRVMTFQRQQGVQNLVSQVNQADGKGTTQSFDDNNNLASRTDEEGRTTTYTYNSDNQRLSMTEAAGTPDARTTTFTYVSNDVDLPTLVTTPSVAPRQLKQVSTAYDANNNPITITQSGFAPDGSPVSRSITMDYNALGQVTQIDGPRSAVNDVTTLTYYNCNTGFECGQLLSVTNALGHLTTFDNYDAHGQVTQMTGPNGVVTTFTYDLRNRLLTQTQTPPTGPVRVTTNTWDRVGQLLTTTTPDGIRLINTYDGARNLRSITDNLGNMIEYDYDLKGNRIAERTLDPDTTLVRNIDMGHDIRNRVESINAAGSLTQMINDAVGNLTSQTDAKANPPTTNTYDPLDRLTETVDAISGITDYDYDVNDQLTEVTAPNGANTQYVYDDLGNLLTEISPDRGTLAFGYDDAGNVTSRIDARGVDVSYSYDALNRLTLIDYPGTLEDVSFSYDACSNGIGRLCTTDDESGTTQLAYDAFGNVTQQDKTELGITYTTQYTYDLGDRVMTMTYPDGRVATYTRDALGRITDVSMTVDGADANLVNSLTYRADGLLTGQAFGNGIAETRDYDLQGRLETQTIGTTDTRLYTYDANGNVTAFTGNAASASYGYDPLDRLTQDTASVSTSSFTYDGNGNRQTRLQDGKTLTYTYEANSNRLDQVDTETEPKDVVLDATGNTLSDRNTNRTFTYNNAGRLSQFFKKGPLKATYTYNAQGQRTRKVKVTNSGEVRTFVYHYDLLGNLIAETREDGSVRRVYVWVDDRPLAQIKHKQNTNEDILSYLHSDHLNTPRIATNPSSTVVWRWESRAFGNFKIEKDPDGDGTNVNVRLRFPGQFKDGESGLYYNWHRYYDPGKGRYVTSDPIGLDGGFNTYVYVTNNPLVLKDPLGLASVCRDPLTCGPIVPGVDGGGGRGGVVGGVPSREAVKGIVGICKAAILNTVGAIGSLFSSQACGGDDTEECEDDIDPCEDLLALLQVRFVQLTVRASQGVDVKFEVLQYKAARRTFVIECPQLAHRAPKLPGDLDF